MANATEAAPGTSHDGWALISAAILAFSLLASVPGVAAAQLGPSALADAGAPREDAGVAAPYGRALEIEARQVREFLAGRLDPAVDPRGLFDLRLDLPDDALRIERERISLVLDRAADAQPRGGDARVWRGRLALDRARLAFYALPLERRQALVRAHEAQQQTAAVNHEEAISQAEGDARRAERDRQEALDAARRASTEAARLVNEEHARLLAVTRQQAEYEAAMLQRRAELDARKEAVLAWRRRVNDISSSDAPVAQVGARADAAYTELRSRLREARAMLSSVLSAMGTAEDRVPQAGADRLTELSGDIDRAVAVRQRQAVTSKAEQLKSAERELDREQADQLMTEIEALNRLRLELLSSLSAERRDSTLALGKAGWDQAVAEIWQVVLTLRYHVHAALDWAAAIRQGGRRERSAWLVFSLLLKWSLPIATFIWWRRRADGLLARWLNQRRQQMGLRRDGSFFGSDHVGAAVAFLRRVRRSLEWLLLVGFVTWVMPAAMKDLLEVRLASRVLLWIFGGGFMVLAIDAIASRDVQHGTDNTARLRLRSLHLVGRAIVGFGLILTLSDLLVGRGTVYSWVFSTCWFAAIPILFVIISWWRPLIFERFTGVRKPNGFESWVLGNRQPAPSLGPSIQSSLAAVAGGVYLFGRGAFRVLRGQILTFELTRRLLAYLFRRDLSKKAREAISPGYAALPADTYRALGPESGAPEPVRCGADARMREVIERIQAPGGGSVAVVGERGAGKSTLIERICASCTGLVSVTCDGEGVASLRSQLNRALGLAAATPLEGIAESIDAHEHGALLIDDAHFLARPMMGGLADLDVILALMRRYSENCTWIFAFDESVWRFIERSRGAQPLFDHVIHLAPWNEDAIVRLIMGRNVATGLEPDFSELALDLPANADDADIREAVHRTEASYYRLLWDYAHGNPGVALHFWRCSLGVAPSGRVLVRLFDAPDTAGLEGLPDSSAFVFRAVLQLGWARLDDVVLSTSLPMVQVQDALRYGSQHGCFEIHAGRYHINWDWYRAVTRWLQRRHLSFSDA